MDFSKYDEMVEFLNDIKRVIEEKLPLKTEINLKHKEGDFTSEEINKYLVDTCVAIALNGKTLDEIDTSKLSNRDIKTINGLIAKYVSMAKSGHHKQSYRLYSVYEYVNDNDPDICGRALYNYDYDPIDLGEHQEEIEKLGFTSISEMYKAHTKKFKKKIKKNKNRNKKF